MRWFHQITSGFFPIQFSPPQNACRYRLPEFPAHMSTGGSRRPSIPSQDMNTDNNSNRNFFQPYYSRTGMFEPLVHYSQGLIAYRDYTPVVLGKYSLISLHSLPLGNSSTPDYGMDMGLAVDLHTRSDSQDTFGVARMRMDSKSRDRSRSLLSTM